MDRSLWSRVDLPLPWLELATYPTPVEPLPEVIAAATSSRGALFTKRDDLGSTLYGGNKVRGLELLLAEARSRGARVVYPSGASGSHHVLATALHAAKLDLRVRPIVYPQPPSDQARENARQIIARSERVISLPHWAWLPLRLRIERERAKGEEAFFLPPGGRSPLCAVGHVSAALELAEQVEQRLLPAPTTVVVGLGSGASAAGLLLGFWLAARWRLGFSKPPRLHAVRLTPWPLASASQVLLLAERTARLLARLAKRPKLVPPVWELRRLLTVDGSELGPGYGHATQSGRRALELWQRAELNPLDLIYSAKVAAAFLRRARRLDRGETLLFWSTKSSAAPPAISSGGSLR